MNSSWIVHGSANRFYTMNSSWFTHEQFMVMNFRKAGRLTRNYPDLGYHSECSTKYTVLYLELIRALLDPFQASRRAPLAKPNAREPSRGR